MYFYRMHEEACRGASNYILTHSGLETLFHFVRIPIRLYNLFCPYSVFSYTFSDIFSPEHPKDSGTRPYHKPWRDPLCSFEQVCYNHYRHPECCMQDDYLWDFFRLSPYEALSPFAYPCQIFGAQGIDGAEEQKNEKGFPVEGRGGVAARDSFKSRG